MLGRREIIGHLTRLLESELLGASPSLAKLLSFCVNTTLAGEAESLKETTIGVLCFGRTPGYDTKADPIVRVNARRLRTKLELFYEGEGRNDEICISLPKGSYIPKFRRRAEEIVSVTVTVEPVVLAAPEVCVLPPVVANVRNGRRFPGLVFAALLVFIFAGAFAILVRFHRGPISASESAHEPIEPVKNLFDAKAAHDEDELAGRPAKIAPLKLPRKMDLPSDDQKRAVKPEDASSNMLNAFEPRL